VRATDPIAAIRDAFASGEFARAQSLWERYADRLKAEILGGSLPPESLAEARGLIDWARLLVEGIRSQGCDRLRNARVAEIYARQTTAAGP
jgi:hypothetical protein